LKNGDKFFMRSMWEGSKVYYKVSWWWGYDLHLTNGDGTADDKDYIFRFKYKRDVHNGYQGIIYSYDDQTWPPVWSSSAIRCGGGWAQGLSCSMDDDAEADYNSNGSRSWNSMVITDDLGDKKAAIEMTAWSGDVNTYVCVVAGGGTWGCAGPPDDKLEQSQIQICFVDNPGSSTTPSSVKDSSSRKYDPDEFSGIF
jgi:hypothetical protein